MKQTRPKPPLAFNYSSSFRWHKDPDPLTFLELGKLGYKFIFITLCGAHAAMYSVWNSMREITKNEEQAQRALERTKVGHPTESHHVMARVRPFPGAGAALHSRHGRAAQGLGRLQRGQDPLGPASLTGGGRARPG